MTKLVIAQQLAAIAATSTRQLDLKAQKAAHGKSLLFEPKIAASQDFNTVYQICQEGFQELCMLDPRFTTFAQNLFSEQSKTEERTQMTAKENQELDAVLESFLGLIGARLLLKPAVKAVEWLVRRFRIHEYNTEYTILTFLPYHSTPIFLTLLSILPRKISQTYRFLYPYMTSLANPPRQTIVYTATHTAAFFSALNQYVLKVVRAHHQSPNLLSFWASIATQAIDSSLDEAKSGRGNIQRQREEDLLLRILPVLNEGLSIKNAPEMKLGCYMIMTVLATKASLEDKVLNGMMEAVVSSWTVETLDGALVSIAIMAQERQAAKLPKTVVRGLLKLEGLSDTIATVSQQCRADRLALGCALGALERFTRTGGAEGSFDLSIVEGSLQAQVFDDAQTTVVVKYLLLAIHTIGQNSEISEEQRHQLADLLVRLNQSQSIGQKIAKVIEDEGMDVESLELQLKTVLRPVQQSKQDETGDVEMENTTEEPTQPVSIDAVLSSLPTRTTEGRSLLATETSKLFDTLSQAFVQFCEIPLFSKGDEGRVIMVTFFARFWSSSHPALARSAALRITSRWISTVSHDSDFQVLFPYIIYALGDKFTGVRRAAAECGATLGRVYAHDQATPKKIGKKSVWAGDTIYGRSSKDVKWLSTDEASKFVAGAIIPSLEECILDQAHIDQVLRASMDDNKHAGASNGPDFKSALRSALCSFISSNAVKTPIINVGKSGSAARTNIVFPEVKKWLSLSRDQAALFCHNEGLDLVEVDRLYLNTVGSREAESMQILYEVMNGDYGTDRAHLKQISFSRLRAIWPSFKSGVRKEAARFLLDLALASPADANKESRQVEALETLRTIALPGEVLVFFLETIPNAVQLPENPPAAKRRRTSKAEMARFDSRDTEETTKALERLTLVLELVEGSSSEYQPELLKSLFHVLGELQHYRIQTNSSLVYLQSLAISSLLSIFNGIKAAGAEIDRAAIRADLLVDCVRNTSNPQVQNSALLLISSLADCVPEVVLHSVMPIFTYMGSSILRQSDDYSAHVIDQTVSRVVPPLAASLRKKKRDLVLGVAELLLSFTTAYEHIPLHRRLGLFGQLTKTLGAGDSLFAILAMLIEKYPSDKSVRRFAVELMRLFDPVNNLVAARRYLELIEDALQAKPTTSNVLFGLNEKDGAQIERSAVNLLDALAELLQDSQLKNRTLRVLKDSDETARAVRDVFTQLLEKTIQLSHRFHDRTILRDGCSDVLSSLLKLLPTAELVKSADALLDNSSDNVRRTALRSVEAQASSVKQSDAAARSTLLDFMPRITRVILQSSDATLKLTAVACIDQISEKFGKKNTAAVFSAAEIVAGPQSLGSDDIRLRINSLLCLASVVEILHDDFIPLIPKVLPLAFGYLKESIQTGEQSSHNAVYSLLCSVIEHVPFIFSGEYLDSALQLSHQSATAGLGDDSDENRAQFYQFASKQIDAKDCFAAIERNWDSAVNTGYPAPSEHLDMLSTALESRPKSVVIKSAQTLFKFFLKAFDLRRTCKGQSAQEYDAAAIDELEQQINDAALVMIMKLNDASFRPFFVHVIEWVSSLPKKDATGRALRATSLFVFLETFFGKLKSIVTSYSSYIIELAAEILSRSPTSDADHLALCRPVLAALSQSFEHDQDDFWQAPAHFDAISKPLITQLNSPEPLFIIESVISAVTELAVSASSAEHHKELNTAILKYMRADEARVRLAAVKCEQSLTERLGEDWLALLPEMLPFISELQEDDDEDVERETLRWVRRIEEILGESLEGMLQ
ncbi:hypothetical protein K490DRAFT_75160 [Saccharata proteae CBS 121410]|uniref:U3 small nucleolar RNA-associated protein 10 n=1 Tax=Saccharata proteae CBS 121410 TaxID=1314787 RepID=A0A9P4HTY1_9PEZI|nr:hypothetical protein K490DRAFT_75160 [Saccharata proteae CBS 121410]